MLSLLRSTRIITYGDSGGGYGKGNDSSLELNKELTFDYSLIPHAGDWREAGVYRDGMEFNQPLTAYALATHPGPLPKQWGLLEISSSNVVISTLKSGTQGTSVLRIYEAAGKPAAAKIRLSAQVDSAEEVNLMEDPGSKLAVTGSALQFEMKPYEIKTIRLKLQPEKTAK